MIGKDKIRISITFPKPLARQLREQAAKEGKGISDVVVKKLASGDSAKEGK